MFVTFSAGLLSGQVPEKNKKEAKKAYNQALEYAGQGAYEPALTYAEAALDLDNTFTEALLLRAKIEVELGKNTEAASDFLALSGIRPDLGEVDFYRAYLQFPGTADSTLLELFNSAEAKGFKTPELFYLRALLKQQLYDYSGAIADYTETLKLETANAMAFHNRASAKKMLGDLQGALQDYKAATEANHNFPVAFNNMGSVKILLGDYEGALADYSVAINLDSTFYIAYNNRGSAKYYLGNYEEAILDFKKALDINPLYVPAKNNEGSVLGKQNLYEDAISVFDGIITSEPGFAKAFLNRGLIRELTGDLEGACKDWNKAFEMGIAEAEAYIKECK
jgi:tetratricopeptide (TPR) repeat protein